MQIEQKELVEIKSQVSTVQQAVMSLVVENKEDMAKATDALHNVRQAEKFIEEKKKNITSPLMKALSEVRDLFKPMELTLSDANKAIKAKMLAWQIQEDDRIEKEQARIAVRVAKGTMKAETAAGKLEVLGDANTPTEGESGKSSIRDVKKIRVVDEFAIPREWLEPSMARITEAVIRKGITIPGVETFIEKIIVSRSRNDNPNLQ